MCLGLLGCCACQAGSCAAGLTCNCFGKMVSLVSSRIAHAFFFLLASVGAFVFGFYQWDKMPAYGRCSDSCGVDEDCMNSCYKSLTVYGISFGLAAFHLFHLLLMIGANNSNDVRVKYHEGFWGLKFMVLVGACIGGLFLPSGFFVIYGWMCLIGALIFILMQLVLLIDMAYAWNSTLVEKAQGKEISGETNTWLGLLLFITFSLYAGAITMSILVFKYEAECSRNIFFTVFNLCLIILATALSLHPQVKEGNADAGLFQSAVLTIYTTYLLWSSVSSQPDSWECSTTEGSSVFGSETFTLILGGIFTVLAICYTTISTAGKVSKNALSTEADADSLVSRRDEERGKDDNAQDLPIYNYTLFHCVFLLGALYLAMLLTNWENLSQPDANSLSVDKGSAAVWIKIVSSWVVALLYMWTLVAPLIFPNRDF